MSHKNRKLIDSFTACDIKGKRYVINIYSETSTSRIKALIGAEDKECIVLETKHGENVISHGGRNFSICKGMGKFVSVQSNSDVASSHNLFKIIETGSRRQSSDKSTIEQKKFR